LVILDLASLIATDSSVLFLAKYSSSVIPFSSVSSSACFSFSPSSLASPFNSSEILPSPNFPPPPLLAFLSKALIPVPLFLSCGCGSSETPLVFLVSLAFKCSSFFYGSGAELLVGAFLYPAAFGSSPLAYLD